MPETISRFLTDYAYIMCLLSNLKMYCLVNPS
uniref:Uncharacterized protein n=1 Tax=Siphoviridae sp. ctHip2 TaxID=2827830 RepID=A0A8S5RWB3_9CAUD|nr:MAG TPA: hypothetical protein [Siphoviridae sp. ctHip2]